MILIIFRTDNMNPIWKFFDYWTMHRMLVTTKLLTNNMVCINVTINFLILFINILRQDETWVAKRKNSRRSVMWCEICVFCDNYVKPAFCDHVMWNPRCLVKPEFHWPCHVKSMLFSKTWVLLVNVIWFLVIQFFLWNLYLIG